jgi:hypothetical protein
VGTTEHTINDALASVLRTGRRAWRQHGIVSAENTGMLKGNSRRPDILVLEPGVSPVVIETELTPAVTVEPEALSRLGEAVRSNGKTILSSVAVRLPKRLRQRSSFDLHNELMSAQDLEMALYTGASPLSAKRWPSAEWFVGGATQLSLLTQAATVPPEVIDRAANELIDGVSDAAGLLLELKHRYPILIDRIAHELRQDPSEQALRMASAIIANAMVFHESLSGSRVDLVNVLSLSELRHGPGITKNNVLAEWAKILSVNYWPIFDIARRLVEHFPSSGSNSVLERLVCTAEALVSSQLTRSHDLTGAVFQRLIADRKFLAAYYTMPSSAALLAGLALRSDAAPNAAPWSDSQSLKSMRMADFACGTGTLLSAIYTRFGQLHELAGGDAEALHAEMMGHGLVGCDVLPAAAHLTASMLAGSHPTITYKHSSIYTLAYGKQENGSIALGSIDLLSPQTRFQTHAITAKSADAHGETEHETYNRLLHDSFDLVIMNPPFTRATGHEGKKIGVHNPMFAAFQADEATQRIMGHLTKERTKGTSAHGNAGEASIFLAMGDRKLKKGGTLALVMPLSLMVGESWQASRDLLVKSYVDLTVITNAGLGGRPLSFSADTDIGECLVIARKSDTSSSRATFVVLNERPESPSSGSNIASQIQALKSQARLRKLEDGPVGGVPLRLGNELIGSAIDAPIAFGQPWQLSRVRDLALAQSAYQMANGMIWLPSMKREDAIAIPIAKLGDIAAIGPYHADINGKNSAGGVRGPFEVVACADVSSVTYPILWAHDAERECTLEFDADSEAILKIGSSDEEQEVIDKKASAIWETASHCHFNRDFRFNSQSTSMQYTPRKTIGGRAWLSVRLSNEQNEKVMAVWSNTVWGSMLYWWHANKQQDGRGTIGKLPLAYLPVIDVTKLSQHAIEECVSIFDSYKDRRLLPLSQIQVDEVRREIDNAFLRRVLCPENWLQVRKGTDLLRVKLAQEPSILGGKGRAADGDAVRPVQVPETLREAQTQSELPF